MRIFFTSKLKPRQMSNTFIDRHTFFIFVERIIHVFVFNALNCTQYDDIIFSWFHTVDVKIYVIFIGKNEKLEKIIS